MPPAGVQARVKTLLAARAPRLDRALAKVARQGGEVVLPDGTLIPTRRRTGTANRRNYNGKHKKHGLLFLALTDESGNPAWISCARRSAASEITAARAPVEHGFSDLKNWRILTRLRLSPANATTLLRALLVLTRQHTSR